MYNEKQQLIIYNKCVEHLKHLARLEDLEGLKDLKRYLTTNNNLFVDVKKQLLIFVNACISVLEDNNKIVISEPSIFKPINNTLDIEKINYIKSRLKTIKSNKLLFHFKGLINLLEDKNLIYNEIYKRNDIIDYLSKFKSLNFFNIGYINISDLDNKYSFLSVKKDKIKFYSKIQLINNCIIFNTLEHDNISIKVLYTNKKDLKVFYRKNNNNKKILTDNKYNISSIDYKNINKLSNKDKIAYYTYLKNNMLDKKNRRLLKEIHKSSYISHDEIDILFIRNNLLNKIEDLKEDLKDLNNFKSNNDIVNTILDLEDLNNDLIDLDKKEDLFKSNIEGEKRNVSLKLKTYL